MQQAWHACQAHAHRLLGLKRSDQPEACTTIKGQYEGHAAAASNPLSACMLRDGTGDAGMRIGYGAFPLGLISYMWRAKQPYNVSVAAEVAACAALSEPEYLQVCAT